jgi:hypothetical protein
MRSSPASVMTASWKQIGLRTVSVCGEVTDERRAVGRFVPYPF